MPFNPNLPPSTAPPGYIPPAPFSPYPGPGGVLDPSSPYFIGAPPTGGGPPVAVPPQPQYNLTDLMNLMRQLSPLQSMGGSDELNRAYIAAQAQQNTAALGQSTQLLGQQQTNNLRLMELMGSSGGQATDAATRWRQELDAQQKIQGTRLQQEYAQMLGYTLDANGNPTAQQTVGGRQQTMAEQQARAQQDIQYANLFGYQGNMAQGQTGPETLETRKVRQDAELAAAQRALQERMQGTQYGHETEMQQGLFGQQKALQQGQQQWQSGESQQERALRERLQSGQQQWQSGESQQERDLRERLQSGQLNQQESEFARSYLLQQQESRRQQAELSGYLGADQGGGLTEQARATRAQEQTQRAQLAAQLLNDPKDVFKAGAYFRALGGGNPSAMGLTGGGIMGFNSRADRAAGTPGTVGLEDMDKALGGGLGQGADGSGTNAATTQAGGGDQLAQWAALQGATGARVGADGLMPAPQASQVQIPNATTQANVGQLDATMGASGAKDPADGQGAGGGWVTQEGGQGGSGAGDTTMRTAVMGADPEAAAKKAGMAPAGPVGAVVDGQLGDLGMGAGGRFPGRVAAGGAAGTIPYVDPSVFQEPAVKAMVTDMKRVGRSDRAAAGQARRGSSASAREPGSSKTASMVEVGPYRFGQQTAEGRRNADERFVQGLGVMRQRGLLGTPGTGPGGPVDAPLWPSGAAAGSAMPSLQDNASLGGSSFQAPPTPPPSMAPAPAPSPLGTAIPSLDPQTQADAMGTIQDVLGRGVGALGPQTWEAMSKTQRGLTEGGLEAAGLSLDDFLQSYAQTRFNNTGDVGRA